MEFVSIFLSSVFAFVLLASTLIGKKKTDVHTSSFYTSAVYGQWMQTCNAGKSHDCLGLYSHTWTAYRRSNLPRTHKPHLALCLHLAKSLCSPLSSHLILLFVLILLPLSSSPPTSQLRSFFVSLLLSTFSRSFLSSPLSFLQLC